MITKEAVGILNYTMEEIVFSMKRAVDKESKEMLLEVERLRALDQYKMNHLEKRVKEQERQMN
jgi:hypothetical protein